MHFFDLLVRVPQRLLRLRLLESDSSAQQQQQPQRFVPSRRAHNVLSLKGYDKRGGGGGCGGGEISAVDE